MKIIRNQRKNLRHGTNTASFGITYLEVKTVRAIDYSFGFPTNFNHKKLKFIPFVKEPRCYALVSFSLRGLS